MTFGDRKKTGFHTKARKPLRQTQLRKVGIVGRANLKANKRLREVLSDINYCELGLKDCLGGMYLTNAHRHKRAWYKGDVELLSDKIQVVKACVNCHETIEHNSVLTAEIFISLRGEE